MILQSLQFYLFGVQKMILSNCCQIFKNTVPFDDIVRFIDEENIVI